ncbi:MAG: glycoside hydrolase family 28 protein [Vicinamibacteria bacterium]|nr:glycoside hydrolase family 28 protein [Vicinamibacteria bacterium]
MLRLAAAALALLLGAAAPPSPPPAAEPDPWLRAQEIVAGLQAPRIPDRECRITAYGARPEVDVGDAIARAIADCHGQGGGRVVIPAGAYDTGPIHLKSRIALHLERGATLRFDRNPKRYLPLVVSRWEGVELMNYSPLVYALDQEDVAITGEGTLDGQAGEEHWWPWKRDGVPHSQRPARDRLLDMAERGVPVSERVFGEGSYLRPSFVQFYRCKRVAVEGVTLRDAPMWVIHPVLSQHVTVRRVTILSHGPNSDGCNPESSSDVLIEDSLFDTGDDCIALKSGRNADGRRLATPVERVVVRGCRMKAGHGGVTLGSEISGGARDVFAERLLMSSPDLERGIRFKTNARRGGVIEHVYVRDVEIGEVGNAIDVDLFYEEGPDGPFPPTIRDVTIERLGVRKAQRGLVLRAFPGSTVERFVVKDTRIESTAEDNLLEGPLDLALARVLLGPKEAR